MVDFGSADDAITDKNRRKETCKRSREHTENFGGGRMKIAAINGSSKKAGISALIIKQMEKLLDEQIEIYHAMKLVRAETPKEAIGGMLEADILLIVFPLYIDSLPFPLIELLTRLENTVCYGAATPQIFTIVNGALDSAQTTLALEMIAHFACRVGLPWGYGVGNLTHLLKHFIQRFVVHWELMFQKVLLLIRHCSGVFPVFFLNTRKKYLILSYPTVLAI